MRIHLLIALLVAALAAVPAGAVDVTRLDVAVGPGGAADVSMDYDLNPLERFVAYAAVAVPGRGAERTAEAALEALSGRKVHVRTAGPDGAAFTVQRFATVTHRKGTTTYVTPAVDFTAFGRALDRYWFKPLVTPDYSPLAISLTFPDGHAERFDGRAGLPAVTHHI